MLVLSGFGRCGPASQAMAGSPRGSQGTFRGGRGADMERDRRSTIFFSIAALLTCTGFGVVVHSGGYLRGSGSDDSSLGSFAEAAPGTGSRASSGVDLEPTPGVAGGLNSDGATARIDGDPGGTADEPASSDPASTVPAQFPGTFSAPDLDPVSAAVSSPAPAPVAVPVGVSLDAVADDGHDVADAVDRSGGDEAGRNLGSGTSGSGTSGSGVSGSSGSGSKGSNSTRPVSVIGADLPDEVDPPDSVDPPVSVDPPDSND